MTLHCIFCDKCDALVGYIPQSLTHDYPGLIVLCLECRKGINEDAQ